MDATVEEQRAEDPISTQKQFYAAVVSQADLEAARQVEGLEEEIAVLRVQLRQAVREHPKDIKLMSQGLGMLVKAVAAQYRLSPRAKRDLTENLAGILNSFGDLILPADR